MLLLGHMGIGKAMVGPVMHDLPKAPFFIGALLPDLIDKPLYYGLVSLTGLRGEQLGVICGTRTLAHTGIFLLILSLIAFKRNSGAWFSLALGVTTHLALDAISDPIDQFDTAASARAILYPLLNGFSPAPFQSLGGHVEMHFGRVYSVGGEIVGAILLLREWRALRVARGKL